jgi:hypothetical protein
MSTQDRIGERMRRLNEAHTEFSVALRAVWLDERPHKAHRSQQQKWLERNRLAAQVAEELRARRDALLAELLQEIRFDGLMRGDPAAIDGVLDFFEVDVLAFRCGPIKDRCLRRLKSLPLTDSQIERLRRLALAEPVRPGRGLKLFAHLMIRLADQVFIAELQDLAAIQAERHSRQKAGWMLRVILNGRPDLRPA